MKILVFFLFITLLFIMPIFVYANCNNPGTTVVFVNGVFGTETSAKSAKDLLEQDFKYYVKRNDITFINGFNASHANGTDDLITSVIQFYKGGYVDYDLTNILKQVHGELKTRKILLVGFSQGTFYTNGAYNYLIQNGVDKNSIAVYNVATPADRVEGNGKYLTSSTDKVINSIVARLTESGFARKPLSPNISLRLSKEEENDPFGGHSFSDVYLAEAPDRIISDIDSQLNSLQESKIDYDLPDGSCFVEPKTDIAYALADNGFYITDNFGYYLGNSSTTGLNSTAAANFIYAFNWISQKVYDLGNNLALSFNDALSGLFSKILLASSLTGSPVIQSANSNPPQSVLTQNSNDNQPDSSTAENLADYSGIGGLDTNPTTEEQRQDLLDDIQEKLDILAEQVRDLTQPADISQENKDVTKNEGDQNIYQQDENNQNTNNQFTQNGGVSYSKILISEVQTQGPADSKQEFVELYSPNNQEVDLTGWYLQRKTASASSWSTYASNNLFLGKKIPALGYFLIARSGYYFTSADIFTDNAITSDNSFALKNPNGEISDKFGFGNAQDPEFLPAPNPDKGQTIGRKVLQDGSEEETDNNLNDFEIQTPTPKAKNLTYAELPQPGGGAGGNLIDTLAPVVNFTLEPEQITSLFPINFTITDPLGTVSPSGLNSYVFRWQEQQGAWQEDSSVNIFGNPQTYSAERDFTGQDGKTYNFQVKAKDSVGNEGDWQPEIPVSTAINITKKILINEIQTAGVTTKDEFVELYNPNNVDVNLTGFALKKKTSGGTESNLVSSESFSGTITALGYFLIAPPKNSDGSVNYTGFAIPDLYYSGKTFSIASNNAMLLYDKHNILLDKVGFGTALDFETSPTVNPATSKSIERKKIGLDTDNNLNDFRMSDSPTPGASFMKASIQDSTNYVNNFGSSTPGASYYFLTIKWQSPNAQATYNVQYRLNSGNWKNWQNSTSKTQDNFQAPYSLLSDDIYDFRAQATDSDGNTSDWASATINLSNPVSINEISVFNSGTKDEQWIELYNKSDKDIDITGWQLVSNNTPIVLSGIIGAKSFFLLEKGDDNTVSDVKADQIYSVNFTNTATILLLDKNNRLIDQVLPPFGSWDKASFKTGANYYSYERISPYSFGSDTKNWKFNNGATINGKDRNGNIRYGTPKSLNSNFQIYTSITRSFIEDAVLKKSLSPYVFRGGIYIANGTTLTIEPGVIIKFDYQSGVTIDGTLLAPGLLDSQIIFTSLRNDQYAGDTNLDASTTLPGSGDWLGLEFQKDSINSALDNVVVSYGGGAFGKQNPAISADNTSLSLKNAVLDSNKDKGLLLLNSSSVIDNVQFLNHQDASVDQAKAIDIQGGSPEIKNSSFTNNYYGIYIEKFYNPDSTITEASPIISNNNFEKNNTPIFFGNNCYPDFQNNSASVNTFNATVFGGDVAKDMDFKADLPYLIKRISVVSEDKTLTIEPGVIFEFQDNFSGLQIDGTIKALGTSGNPVVFRPYYYDQSWILPGNWLGLYFTSKNKNSDLENIDISFGGAHYGNLFGAALKVEQSSILLKNSFVHDNANNGLWLTNSPSVIDYVTFLNHKTANLGTSASAVFVQGGNPEIKNSQFQSQTYGIFENKWTDPGTSEIILPNANLHILDPLDPEKNVFIDSDIADIHDATAP